MNLRRLDLNLLLVFDALQRTRSTTLAAEQIGVTQSAVSNALRRLRDAFGDDLFVRTEQGMMPTPLAKGMADSIRGALAQISQTLDNQGPFDPARCTRHFRIACSDIGQATLLPPLIGRVQELAPNVTIETVPLSRQGMAELMTSGDIDLALGVFRPLGAGFVRQRLRTLRFVCIVRKSHPTIHDKLTLQQFLDASFIEYQPTGGSYEHFAEYADRQFNNHQVVRRVATKLAHLTGIAQLVANSNSLCVVPEVLAHRYAAAASLCVLELPFDVPLLDVTQQWHERINKDPAHIWLRHIVTELSRSVVNAPVTSAVSSDGESSVEAQRDQE